MLRNCLVECQGKKVETYSLQIFLLSPQKGYYIQGLLRTIIVSQVTFKHLGHSSDIGPFLKNIWRRNAPHSKSRVLGLAPTHPPDQSRAEQSSCYFLSAAPPTMKGHCWTKTEYCVLGWTHTHEFAKDPLPNTEKGSHISKHSIT